MEASLTRFVHTLLCHRDVEMALTCLGSLLRFSVEPVQIIIHDDGSLVNEDKSKLLNELKDIQLISRSEADELMNQKLSNYPNCHRYRTDHVFGLKLLDIPLLSQEDIAYCDSDILFMRPFRHLFHISEPSVSALFMQDTKEAYSLSFQGMFTSASKLASRVNAGLIFLRKDAYDLDFTEWFLGAKEYQFIPYFIEQTFWAALGQKVGCRLWNPEQVIMVKSEENITDETAVAHFISGSRHLIYKSAAKLDIDLNEKSPIIPQTIPSKKCNISLLAPWVARHKLGAFKQSIVRMGSNIKR